VIWRHFCNVVDVGPHVIAVYHYASVALPRLPTQIHHRHHHNHLEHCSCQSLHLVVLIINTAITDYHSQSSLILCCSAGPLNDSKTVPQCLATNSTCLRCGMRWHCQFLPSEWLYVGSQKVYPLKILKIGPHLPKSSSNINFFETQCIRFIKLPINIKPKVNFNFRHL